MTTEEQPDPRDETRYPDFYIAQGELTVEYAKELLADAENNRNPSLRNVGKFAEAIRRGDWDFQAAPPIRINTKGRMNDGQHRCLAVIEANQSIETLFYYGVTDDIQLTVDTGKQRSFSDYLRLQNIPNSILMASSVRLLWDLDRKTFDRGKTWTERSTPSNTELYQYYQTLDPVKLLTAARVAEQTGKNSGVNRAAMAAFYFSIAPISQEDADDFVDKLKTGANLGQKSPILALRRLLDRDNRARPRPNYEQFAVMAKAWNYYRQGREVSFISVKLGGKRPEAFPEPM